MTVNNVATGALNGATLKPILRYGDLENKVSIGTAAVFLSKDRFKENNPYSKEYDVEGNLRIHINLHFIAEVRRQLAGNEEPGTSTFSPEELTLWNEYQEAYEGVPKYGEVLAAIEALDRWLIDELVGISHDDLNRSYDGHKWDKTEERNQTKGIKWL